MCFSACFLGIYRVEVCVLGAMRKSVVVNADKCEDIEMSTQNECFYGNFALLKVKCN